MTSSEIVGEGASSRGGSTRDDPADASQLVTLAATYKAALATPDRVRAIVDAIGARQAVYIASGGAYPVARFAADIHLARTGAFAVASTPLMLAHGEPLRDAAAVVISARAAHPDVALALDLARRSLMYPVALLTTREPGELGRLVDLASMIERLPLDGPREGFLATRSVVAMATAFAATLDRPMPAEIPLAAWAPAAREARPRSLVLFGQRQAPAALDLETRLSETGLSAVQAVDYRNFAHGRHLGLAANLDETQVVALIDPDDRRVAEATLAVLPRTALVLRLETELQWPASTIDLMVGSMRLVTAFAATRGLDLAHPSVPQFGRRLYRLPTRRRVSPRTTGPVERKLLALGRPASYELQRTYANALAEWLERLRSERVDGLVIDYDGTLCHTAERFDLPRAPVRDAIARHLETGLVGIASGRGRSLWRDLRSWVPARLWERMELGLYNGTVLARLDEEIALSPDKAPGIAEFVDRLADHPVAGQLRSDVRPTQVSLTGRDGIDVTAIASAAVELIGRAPTLPLRIVTSGHSVDVVATTGSKRDVFERIAERVSGSVLAIGDQGQVGGNDFELLATTWTSLSVDRCSADPTRCWNLLTPAESGPSGVLRYLAALGSGRSGRRFRWPSRAR